MPADLGFVTHAACPFWKFVNCPAAHVLHDVCLVWSWNWPAAHPVHVACPDVFANVPAAHAEHTRLLVAVGAVVPYSPAAHVASAVQTRLLVAVGAALWNCAL